jgi:hypothetical protein
MSKRKGLWLILGILIIFFIYCSEDDNTSNPSNGEVETDPSFSGAIQPIFNSSCALSNCHNSTAQAGLVLLEGQSYGNIVDVPSTQRPAMPRVMPAKTDSSYIVIKIEGTEGVTRMPPGGALGSSSIQLIKNWIIAGAKDN